MASVITIKCLNIIIGNKNVLNIYMILIFFIKYMLYKNVHDRTISILLNVIIFLKIGFANLDATPILAPFPFSRIFQVIELIAWRQFFKI